MKAALGVVAAVAAAVCVQAAPALAYPNPGTVAGDTIVHDPSMAITSSAPRYIVYGSNNTTLTSEDRITFERAAPYFPLTPAWWKPYSKGDVWAPDVSFHNGLWWMYYAVSSFGSQTSAIGVATSSSGLPGTWTDHGVVISSPPPSSYTGPQYNTIDPNLVVDPSGNWWLVFGSFWGGIFITQLDPATGKLKDPTAAPTQLATRPAVANDPIEGAFMYQHGGYYYLFASYDYCCNSNPATDSYNVRVGRSTSPTGPFTDEAGTSMLQGGGTTVMATHGYVVAPGGESVYFDDYWGPHDLLVYHYLDSRLAYEPFLGINFLGWDANGFPYAY